MNVRIVLIAALVAVVGAGALLLCDDADAAAGDVLASGSCGTSLTYEIRSLSTDDSQVELVISGSGEMTNWESYSSVPWYTYRAKIMTVTLPEGLTHIGSYAFYECTRLALTSLPDGITSISKYAFYGCTRLALTSLPDGITYISDYTFSNCTALALTELPAGINYIANYAFRDCTNIKNLTMPSVTLNLSTGLTYLESLTYTSSADWTSSKKSYSPQYTSKNTLQSITFADDRIPAYALYGQNLDRLTITNADGADILGIYTAPGTRATAEDLTVNGLAAQIVRLADVSGSAELADDRITADDVTIGWEITPEEYGGETTASPDVLIYPAEFHSKEPNDYGVWMTTISILLVVGLLVALILPMIARRLE